MQVSNALKMIVREREGQMLGCFSSQAPIHPLGVRRAHYVSLPPGQKFFWPEYENSCIFRASCHKDVLVFMLFYHRKKIPKLGCQSGEIEGGAQVGTLVGLLCLRHGRWQNSDPFAKNYRSCPIRTQNRVTSKLGLLQPRIGL